MKAIRIAKFGPPSVLQLQTVDIPKVAPAEVLVKIKSSGVNPVDTYIREGAYARLPELPFTPGKDGAGIVHAIGEAVSKLKVGQRVFICGMNLGKYGTCAEYSLAPQTDVFPLDDKLNFDEGAALGIAYFTAYRALVLKAKCSKGEYVLIHGASGAVGLASVQLAKKKGLTVIGTAGTPEGMTLVKTIGADYVLCHKQENYIEKIMEITENRGVDIICEMLANVNLDKDLDVIAPKGRIAIIGSRGAIKIDPRKTMFPEATIVGVALWSSSEEEWTATANCVLEAVKDGSFKPVVGKKYPLEKAAEAHKEIIHSSGAKGKLILTVEEA